MDDGKIELLAQKFRADHGLGEAEALNMKSIVRKCNILTVYLPMSEKACGLSVKSPQDDSFILVNSSNSKGRQHYTIAHEIFHLYYDENPFPHICELNGSSPIEKTANKFAAALLMPKDGVLQLSSATAFKSNAFPLALVLKMEQYFRVSRESMLYRLKHIGLISEDRLQELLAVQVIHSAKEYGYDTSLYNPGNEYMAIGDYGEKARILFDNGVISEGHYLELLNMISHERQD